jgi:protein-S-isoprenylcysteine O-methyltransferase Ste14
MPKMKPARLMPTSWLLIALVTMVALRFLLPLTKIVPGPWNLLGIIPLALGVAMNLVADGAFRKAKTTVKPFQESSALVTDGVFRITRNPMYVGFVLILTGAATLLGRLTPCAVIPAFVVLIDRTYIRSEERMLAQKFGAAWRDYSGKTRRWL